MTTVEQQAGSVVLFSVDFPEEAKVEQAEAAP